MISNLAPLRGALIAIKSCLVSFSLSFPVTQKTDKFFFLISFCKYIPEHLYVMVKSKQNPWYITWTTQKEDMVSLSPPGRA